MLRSIPIRSTNLSQFTAATRTLRTCAHAISTLVFRRVVGVCAYVGGARSPRSANGFYFWYVVTASTADLLDWPVQNAAMCV